MEPYALQHAISEVKDELRKCDIEPNTANTNDIINWAFKILHIAEMKQLNKNLDRICSQINRIV